MGLSQQLSLTPRRGCGRCISPRRRPAVFLRPHHEPRGNRIVVYIIDCSQQGLLGSERLLVKTRLPDGATAVVNPVPTMGESPFDEADEPAVRCAGIGTQHQMQMIRHHHIGKRGHLGFGRHPAQGEHEYSRCMVVSKQRLVARFVTISKGQMAFVSG